MKRREGRGSLLPGVLVEYALHTMPNRPRPHRVAIQGARIRFANTPADLLNVSRSGALIRLGYQPRTGGEWPLVLELPNHMPQWLTGRVVRTQSASGTSPGAPVVGDQFLLALKFVNPPLEVVEALDQACGTTPPAAIPSDAPAEVRTLEESVRSAMQHLRRLSLSLRRRCPECGSPDVSKEFDHRYACDQCGVQFAGFRLGPVRVSL